MSQYATAAQLAAIPSAQAYVTGISEGDRNTALVNASAEADDYLASQYTLPLSAWPDSLSMHVAHIAAYRLATGRGFNTEGGPTTLRTLYDDAIAWLKAIRAGSGLAGVTDSTPTVEEGGTYVVTNTRRGWR